MSVLERPHYVIKPTDLARWLDQEPETWWMVNFDPRLTGTVDFPCPSDELSDALRSYHGDLFIYPIGPASPKPNPSGQPIEWERLGDLFDREGAEGRRTFVLSWSDRDDEWVLSEYPASLLPELQD